ncbi:MULTISPECIES: LysR substrate-binding domain-containing protein [unclassified Lysobacter]|uniref:LysR substrate-binding domain-containing protein n=1 Tax=unclassified Lysobacter TaxID=2635362 RepID=UPI0006F247D4|nr:MULTISPECIES: LysR substrate-binding domain-containing protein [unclassified Lysobacter]KQZ57060.1 LysR family transcriptional regulator [Lysobacter sp. Root559]KRC34911.1 LysR family transcriptional regulator [Lysobacter sp. Root76]KRD70600.1 LysR family transcriptional regulator [Lysobacter sp. Root96]
MLNLNDLVLFAAAVEEGGFAAAGRRLGVPKSTVSKRVAELEAGLQARLIHRTSRSFTLTEVGRDFYEHARAALIETEAAEASVRQRVAEPSGSVRITASVPTAQLYLAEHLPRLAQRHPKLQLQLDVTDRFVDLVQEGYDIALRSHFAPLPDSGLVQRSLVVETIVLVAAPAYLDAQGMPATPSQLSMHDGLLTSAAATAWNLQHRDGERAQATPRARMSANESTALLRAACAGLGIACLPEAFCARALRAGELQRVLPDWNAGRVTTTLVMPHRRGLLPGVRATVEFLADCLGETQQAGEGVA